MFQGDEVTSVEELLVRDHVREIGYRYGLDPDTLQCFSDGRCILVRGPTRDERLDLVGPGATSLDSVELRPRSNAPAP